jgi:carboxyl-terminal processing protease
MKFLNALIILFILWGGVFPQKAIGFETFLGCREVLNVLKFAQSEHFSGDPFTLVNYRLAINNYVEYLDPLNLFFLESDIESFQNSPSILLKQAPRDLQRGIIPKIFMDISVVFHMRSQESFAFLSDLPNKRVTVGLKAGQMNSEYKFPDQRATTLETRNERLVEYFASWQKIYEKNDFKSGEAFVMAVRKMNGIREEAEKDTNQRLIPTHIARALLKTLDPHTNYLPKKDTKFMYEHLEGKFGGIGAELSERQNGAFVENVIPNGPAHRAGIKRGDIITHIDGKFIVRKKLEEVYETTRGPKNTPVNLRLLRDKEPLNFTINREIINYGSWRVKPEIKQTSMGSFGTLRFNTFFDGVAIDVGRRISEMINTHKIQGLVLDLRGNGGGSFDEAVDMAGLFIPQGPITALVSRGPRVKFQGAKLNTIWSGPLVVLIDESSASASELLAGALKDYGRAIIVGSAQSRGKGSMQRVTSFGDLGMVKVTKSIFMNPAGGTPQKDGIKSDVVFLQYPNAQPHFEKDKVSVLEPLKIQSYLDKPYPMMPNREELVQRLVEASLERVQKDSRWNSLGDPKQEDLYLEEATHIAEDLARISGR